MSHPRRFKMAEEVLEELMAERLTGDMDAVLIPPAVDEFTDEEDLDDSNMLFQEHNVPNVDMAGTFDLHTSSDDLRTADSRGQPQTNENHPSISTLMETPTGHRGIPWSSIPSRSLADDPASAVPESQRIRLPHQQKDLPRWARMAQTLKPCPQSKERELEDALEARYGSYSHCSLTSRNKVVYKV